MVSGHAGQLGPKRQDFGQGSFLVQNIWVGPWPLSSSNSSQSVFTEALVGLHLPVVPADPNVKLSVQTLAQVPASKTK